MEKVVIIGGGASGLIASIYAKTKTNEVIILERNSNCLKKLLMTGNGRCNYFNEDQNLSHYHSNNPDILSNIISKKNQEEILTFFQRIGITPKIKNGYYYPFSNQAISIKHALLLEAKIRNVIIKTEQLVKDIKYKDHKFIITSNKKEIQSDIVIIATGSKACPKTGSDGIGYELAHKLGHLVLPVKPALVSLIGSEHNFKKWSGIRTDVILELYDNGKKIKTEKGEIQLTDYGISGICVFNISRYIMANLKNKKININFLPFLSTKEECRSWLDEQNKKVKNRSLGEILEATLNYKLVDFLLKQINLNKKWNQYSNEEKNKIINQLHSYPFEVEKISSYEKAQTCSGGVPLLEINTNTMESNIVKNLYLTGEILDVDGDCGGYNLSFAWITGMLAGKDIRSKTNDSN